MSRRLIALFLVVFFIGTKVLSAQVKGKLLTLNIPAPSLSNNIIGLSATQPVAVYLPPSYESSNGKFPVVFFLPGFGDLVSYWTNGTYQGFKLNESMDQLIKNSTIKEFIVVIPSGYNFLGGSFYVNSPVIGNWENFITKDVVEYIDSNYRTINDKNSRVISGHSMGGFGAMNLAMRHPDLFCAVYALSPGFFALDGLKSSQLFKSQSFINQFIQKGKELNNLSAQDAFTTFKSYIQNRYNSGDWDTPFVYAYGAAFSPDSNKKAPFIDYPYYKSGEQIFVDSSKLNNYENGYGGWAGKVEEFKENLQSLKLITIDVGTNDGYAWIKNGCDYFDRLLTTKNITHKLVKFSGGHEDHVRERIEKYLMPALSNILVYDTTTTGIKTGSALTPGNFDLVNYPNPFNPSTSFHFFIPKTNLVKMDIYNLLGEKICNIINEVKTAGEYDIIWNAENLPGGVYFCHFESGVFSKTQKVILLK